LVSVQETRRAERESARKIGENFMHENVRISQAYDSNIKFQDSKPSLGKTCFHSWKYILIRERLKFSTRMNTLSPLLRFMHANIEALHGKSDTPFIDGIRATFDSLESEVSGEFAMALVSTLSHTTAESKMLRRTIERQ
jgi:hypothetical protein